MAIYIEEERNNGGGFLGILMILVLVIIIGAGIYYTFFVRPEIIENIAPTQLQSVDKLVNMGFDPGDVVNSDFFNNLNQVVPKRDIPSAGNASPFGVF